MLILTLQLILKASGKASGREMMDRFHAETGVPMISCGLGGIMHPAHVLFEAGLLPHGAKVPAYINMIDIIIAISGVRISIN